MLTPRIPFHLTWKKKKRVLIAVRDTVTFRPLEVICDPQGRFLILICEINTTMYTVANIYAPNTRQIRFFHRIMRKICKVQKGLLVMCGDFNTTPYPTIESTSKPKCNQPSLHRWDWRWRIRPLIVLPSYGGPIQGSSMMIRPGIR